MLPMLFLTAFILAADGALLGDQYVINGNEVAAGEMPYHVYITTSTGEVKCGGVLYDPVTVLTIASCIPPDNDVSDMSVVCGVVDRNAGGGQTRPASYAFRHNDYQNNPESGYANNVAIIRVSNAFTYNENCSAATLTSDSDGDFAGQTAVISGWGVHDEGGTTSSVLLKANVTVLNEAACKSYWGDIIDDGHLCVQEGADFAACHGDGGSPVTVKDVVIGIISFGQGDCSPTAPEVATRVSSYRAWLDEQIIG